MTTPQEKVQFVSYPSSLRQNQMFRPSETTEVSMEETHHHILQFVMAQEIYGDMDSVQYKEEWATKNI